MRLILALVLTAGLSACSSGSDSPRSSASGGRSDPSKTPACAEVRAGIDAFNRTEFTNTVAHFRLALPLARQQARTHPSQAAKDLVEAVGYYSELAPADYARAALSSPEFAKYKVITLGQCQPDGSSPDESPKPPAVPA